MTDEELQKATVAVGHWLYGGTVEMTVRVIGLPYDYWYSVGEADGRLEEDEAPEPLGQDALIYYPYFTQIDGPGHPTVLQAKGYAQSKVQVPIRWD